jgi:hypothetical protein
MLDLQLDTPLVYSGLTVDVRQVHVNGCNFQGFRAVSCNGLFLFDLKRGFRAVLQVVWRMSGGRLEETL